MNIPRRRVDQLPKDWWHGRYDQVKARRLRLGDKVHPRSKLSGYDPQPWRVTRLKAMGKYTVITHVDKGETYLSPTSTVLVKVLGGGK